MFDHSCQAIWADTRCHSIQKRWFSFASSFLILILTLVTRKTSGMGQSSHQSVRRRCAGLICNQWFVFNLYIGQVTHKNVYVLFTPKNTRLKFPRRIYIILKPEWQSAALPLASECKHKYTVFQNITYTLDKLDLVSHTVHCINIWYDLAHTTA